jgi:hypothetical protein
VVLSLERKHLEKVSKFRRVEAFKGEAQKTEVRRKNKYGGLSRRNPSEKNFEDWIGSRVKIHSERTEMFRVVRSRRSSALVSCEEIPEFRKTKGLGRSNEKFAKRS